MSTNGLVKVAEIRGGRKNESKNNGHRYPLILYIVFSDLDYQFIKKFMKYKYSREEIAKELTRFELIGFESNNIVHGRVASFKVTGALNFETKIKPMLLAKAEPTPPVSEDKTVEGEIEPPKNIKYLNSDLKRWTKEITKAVNHLSSNAKTK